MSEDEFSGEKSVIRDEPGPGDFTGSPRFFRSFSAIALVFGTLGVVLLPFGLIRFHQGAIPGSYRVPIFDQSIQATSLQALWMLGSSVIGCGLAGVLMIGGIGGVLMKPWSLIVLRLWAIASLLFGLCGCYFFGEWLLPPWRNQLAEVRGVDDSLVNLGGWLIGSFLAVAILVITSNRQTISLVRSGKAATHLLT